MTDLEERFIPAFYQMIDEDDNDDVFEDESLIMYEYMNPVKYPSVIST